MADTPYLSARELDHRFGAVQALSRVTLQLSAGEAVWVTGRNGAGKSTLLRALAGLCRPANGRVEVCGKDIYRDRVAREIAEYFKSVGVLLPASQLYRNLTVEENLKLYADLYRIPECEQRISKTFSELGLNGVRSKLIRHCSQGVVRRVAIARSILNNPRLLLLDEVFAHLDVETSASILAVIKGMVREGTALLFTSHDEYFSKQLATRVLQMEQGALLDPGGC